MKKAQLASRYLLESILGPNLMHILVGGKRSIPDVNDQITPFTLKTPKPRASHGSLAVC